MEKSLVATSGARIAWYRVAEEFISRQKNSDFWIILPRKTIIKLEKSLQIMGKPEKRLQNDDLFEKSFILDLYDSARVCKVVDKRRLK